MITGAQVVFKALEAEGVDVVFGVPGGAIMPVYDALVDSPIRHVLMRHEQGAGHAAEGYAHVTGRPGVCFATSGPGACNLVTPLTDAMMDSIPLVAITGQVSRAALGKQAFQEAPVTAITAPVTKKNWLVMDPERVGEVIHEAFHVARSGRPGPVLVDIPKDVQLAPSRWPCARPPAPAPAPPAEAALEAAGRLIAASRRPVLYVGGGAVKADASAELFELAVRQQIPVVTTLMARGVFPDGHPLCFGMPGMHGSYAAVMAMQRADLLISVGARFDDRVTGRLDAFAPGARVVHIDVDQREIGKNRAADVAVVGDARLALAGLNRRLAAPGDLDGRDRRRRWLTTLEGWRERHAFAYEPSDHLLKPQYVIERLLALTGGDALLTAGVGQHQMWASQLWRFERPRRWANSGGAGTMGFAIPAAVGAKAARSDQLVIAIDGDGCFQMTSQELATSVTERLPIVVALINNGHLGMVRQWQELFHERRYSQVRLGYECPDYVRLAEAYGCLGLRARSAGEVDGVIAAALEHPDRTVVIDFQVDESEMCFPMVPAGRGNDEIDLGPVMGRPAPQPALEGTVD
jgi:acetolactate synthase-1/2/3 large subunit